MICLPIPSIIDVFVVLIFKVWFVSLIPQKPQEALNLLVTEERYWALFYMPLYTFLHYLLNALVQIANKMGLKKNSKDGRMDSEVNIASTFINYAPKHFYISNKIK
jgi:hypothetical protein